MKSPKDISQELGEAKYLGDGEKVISGLHSNTREVIKLAATVAARQQVTSVLEVLNGLLTGDDLGEVLSQQDAAWDKGYKAGLRQAVDKIQDAVYPWHVIATQDKNSPVAIMGHAFTRAKAQEIADHWNRVNGSVATYTVEEA